MVQISDPRSPVLVELDPPQVAGASPDEFHVTSIFAWFLTPSLTPILDECYGIYMYIPLKTVVKRVL